MSSPDYRLRLSPKAHQDIRDILRYTGKTWGEKQLLVYEEKIKEALEAVMANPGIGHGSRPLPVTHRIYTFASHLLVYQVKGSEVRVARILHQRMNVSLHP